MSVLVIVNGSPVWTVSSLEGAMELAKQYTYDGRDVQLAARQVNELHTWQFDYDRRIWVNSITRRAAIQARPANDYFQLAA